MNTIIKREDMDRGEVDFADVASGRQLSLVHPGEILRDEFLTPMELSVYRLAQVIKVSRPRLNDIVLGRRSVTTDTALRLVSQTQLQVDDGGILSSYLQTRYFLLVDVAERSVWTSAENRSQEPRAIVITHDVFRKFFSVSRNAPATQRNVISPSRQRMQKHCQSCFP